MAETSALTPTRIDKHSPTEMLMRWSDGAEYAVPFAEMRFLCPCAGCVDEHTGQRTIQRSSVKADIRAVSVAPVGRYAVALIWSDGHATGIYHFDRLHEISQKFGRRIA